MTDETKDTNATIEGQSFRNEALTGSGTIYPDGTIGDPLPDPTLVRGLGGRRTSGGRLLPDLPSTEVDAVLGRASMPAEDANRNADESDESASTPARKSTSAAKK
jgi:hypothetical protein